MHNRPATPLLDAIASPADLKGLSVTSLKQIADELRAETISAVSETGGHLGAGLGVVELTVALHAIFDTPRDRLIWDVGHQCYPHKILTGRRDRIRTIRQGGGLAGFTKRSESEYDPFGAGHSSTSLSAALGFAMARETGQLADLPVGDGIAVIGDGAFSAGMVYEAMNNAGHLGKRFFVILNDNEMSIAPPVGAMSKYLNSIYRGPFQDVKAIALGALDLLPPPMREGAKRARDLVKHATIGGTLFEELGFQYIGPIDGHDMNELHETLKLAHDTATGPVLIHVLTKKGKGYGPAEAAGDRYHGVAKFDVATGKQAKSKPNAPSFTKIFAETLSEIAGEDKRIVAVNAAMPDGTGLDIFDKAHPGRCFDVGIAEQHAVTFCAGLAAGGARPFCAIYSTFLQRGYDQIVHDVAVQNLPVRFAIDRAGLVGADGPTHAGSFDIAFLANLPNMVVMAPSDEAELVRMIKTAQRHDTGPIAFRYPRGEGFGADLSNCEPIEIGKARIAQKGERVAIIAYGTVLDAVIKASEELDFNPTIIDARFAKPLDREVMLDAANNHDAVITIEEGAVGGFGSHVGALYASEGVFDRGLKFRMMTLPDSFIDQDSQDNMRAKAGLDAPSIVAMVKTLF